MSESGSKKKPEFREELEPAHPSKLRDLSHLLGAAEDAKRRRGAQDPDEEAES